MNLKHFARVTAEKAHGGHYFMLKDGKLIGGFNHKHILEKLFDVEIDDSHAVKTYQTRLHTEACAIRVLFEENGRLVTEFPNCATKAQAKSISILQRRVSKALEAKNRREANPNAKSVARRESPGKAPQR